MSKRKLVMEEHEGSVLIGVQQEGCDPVVKTHEGTLEDALSTVPQMLTEAQEKWATSPKNPIYTPPAAPKPTTAPAQKAEDLPLLSGKEKPKAEEAAPAPAPSTAEVPTEVPTEAQAEPVAAAAAPAEPAAAPTGEWEYWLKDGRGPYADVQAAMDAMGLDKQTRPQHNRWDRLSTSLKEQIQRRAKA